MPRLDSLPPIATIWRMRGVIDYACWKGIFYARKWPRRPNMPRSPASQAAAAIFADFSKRVRYTAPAWIAQAQIDVQGVPWTWKEELTRGAYGHLVEWD